MHLEQMATEQPTNLLGPYLSVIILITLSQNIVPGFVIYGSDAKELQ